MVPVPDKDKQFHKREIKAMDKSHRGSTLSNLLWRFLERFGAQLVTFVLSIVLARILDPELFGKVALITVFITILQVIADSGLGSALIQKKDADDLDFSSVFIFNLVFSVVAFAVMFGYRDTDASPPASLRSSPAQASRYHPARSCEA